MENTCLDVEFIQNRDIVSAVCAEIRSLGLLLICTGCDDIEAVIMAFLVSETKKEAWPLCGSCAQKVSRLGEIVGVC
jgi:hypothetical protein